MQLEDLPVSIDFSRVVRIGIQVSELIPLGRPFSAGPLPADSDHIQRRERTLEGEDPQDLVGSTRLPAAEGNIKSGK